MLVLSSPKQQLRSLDWHSDGERIVVAGNEGVLQLWAALDGNLLDEKTICNSRKKCFAVATSQKTQPHPSTSSSSVERSQTESSDSLCITGGEDARIRAWYMDDDLQLLATSDKQSVAFTSLAFSPHEQSFVTASGYRMNNYRGGEVGLWNYFWISRQESEGSQSAVPGDLALRLQAHFTPGGRGAWDVTYAPDGTWVAMGIKYYVLLWETNSTGVESFDLSAPLPEGLLQIPLRTIVRAVAYCPTEKYLAAAIGWKVAILSLSKFHIVVELKGHQQLISTMAFSPDGRLLATGANDDTVKLWETENFSLVATYTWEIGHIEKVTFSPNGLFLAACGRHHAVIWEVDV